MTCVRSQLQTRKYMLRNARYVCTCAIRRVEIGFSENLGILTDMCICGESISQLSLGKSNLGGESADFVYRKCITGNESFMRSIQHCTAQLCKDISASQRAGQMLSFQSFTNKYHPHPCEFSSRKSVQIASVSEGHTYNASQLCLQMKR